MVFLHPFRRNSLLKSALQSKIAKKLFKLLGVQGHSVSLMLTSLKSLSPLPVMISSVSVPIDNRFHATRANSGKIISFYGGTPLLRPRSRGTPSPGAQNFVIKTRLLGAAHSEDFVILACTVLTQQHSVTDGRTNGRTSRQ